MKAKTIAAANLVSVDYTAIHSRAVIAAGPIADLIAQVVVPKVAVADIEIDFLASSVVGRCLVDTVTYTEILSTFKINHHSEDTCAIV